MISSIIQPKLLPLYSSETDIRPSSLNTIGGISSNATSFGYSLTSVEDSTMISSIIQVDDLSYVVTDSDGYESDILYDEDGYVSSMSATQAEMYTVVNLP